MLNNATTNKPPNILHTGIDGQVVLMPCLSGCSDGSAVDPPASEGETVEIHGRRASSESPSWSDASSSDSPRQDFQGSPSHLATLSKGRKTKATLKVASLNISGRGNLKVHDQNNKWNQTHFYMKDQRIAILAIQEAHMTSELYDSLMSKYGRRLVIKYSSDPVRKNANGVAFVLNKDITNVKDIVATEIIPGRAIMLTTNWHGNERLNILNIYAPNKSTENAVFWTDLHKMYTKLHLKAPDIILGDFNLVESDLDRIPSKPSPTASLESLRTLLNSWQMIDGWRERFPMTAAFTFPVRMTSTSQSRLDRIYVTPDLCAASEMWDLQVTPVTTDHKAAIVSLAARNSPYIGRGRWTVHPSILKDKKTMMEIVQKGAHLQHTLSLSAEQKPAGWTPQSGYKHFKDEIRTILRQRSKILINKVDLTIKKLEQEIRSTNLYNTDQSSGKHAEIATKQERLADLKKERHQSLKNMTAVKVEIENECPTKFWSALNKERKPRDIFFALARPIIAGEPESFEKRSDKMADIARDFYNDLQGTPLDSTEQDRISTTREVLENIDITTTKSSRHSLSAQIMPEEVKEALRSSANGKASGLDGLPYEFWKKLTEFAALAPENNPFDPHNVLAKVFQDIQDRGLDQNSSFAEGWLCPIFKNKGDRRYITNYRPITLLNSDYKLMTKIIASRLALTVQPLIHPNQAGFVPGRSILDQIRLTELMFSYAEATEENGLIVALDQEKAYDRIDHGYLWRTLERFKIPDKTIRTIQSLYQQAYTKVVINGEMSSPFLVTRGVRQGDPMSCLLFDLAIEPLAAMLRRSNLRGFQIPGATEKLITTLFADDTTVYLSELDSMETLSQILNKWCKASTAKFNINKTKLIPIGSKAYRKYVCTTRKLSPSQTPLPDGPSDPYIVQDGEHTRILGAYLGNNVDQEAIWKPVEKKTLDALQRWKAGHPSLEGKRLILQYTVGGITQYLTSAQGMPKNIEDNLIRATRNFIWDDRKPKVSMPTLYLPITEGGLGILDLKARNLAIELVWLAKYLNFSNRRPMWTLVTDALFTLAAGQPLDFARTGAGSIPLLHCWNITARSKRLHPSLTRMIKAAKVFNVNIYAARVSNDVKLKLPAWFHCGYNTKGRRLQNTESARCLRHNHGIIRLEDLLFFTKRVRKPYDFPMHHPIRECTCPLCSLERSVLNCPNPQACLTTAMKLLHALPPFWRPGNARQEDGLSLTRHRKMKNREAFGTNNPHTFDPSLAINSTSSLFRIFASPTCFRTPLARPVAGLSIPPPFEYTVLSQARTTTEEGPVAQYDGVMRHYPAISPSVNFSFTLTKPDDRTAYLYCLLFCLDNYPPYSPLNIVSAPEKAISAVFTDSRIMEDQGWPATPAGLVLKQIINSLRSRSAPTTISSGSPPISINGKMKTYYTNSFQWMTLRTEWSPDLSRPTPYITPGIALSSISQASAYRLARTLQFHQERRSTASNIDVLLENAPTNTTKSQIWLASRHRDIRKPIRTFLWKALHGALSIGQYWDHIPNRTYLADCPICRVPETLEHIMKDCDYKPAKKLWLLAKTALRMKNLDTCLIDWPNPLLSGLLVPPEGERRRPGSTRLLRIILSETLYLTWKLRCERRIGRLDNIDLWHTETEASRRWHQALNARLHMDQLLTRRSLGKKGLSRQLVLSTWSGLLHDAYLLPDDWIGHDPRVLVGREPPDR